MNHGRCPTQTDSSNSSHGCECHCALTLRLLIERPTQILTTLPRELPLLQPSRLLTYLLIEHDLFSIGYSTVRPAPETPPGSSSLTSPIKTSHGERARVSIRAAGGITFCCLVGSESRQLPASVIPTPFACGDRSHTGNLHFQCLWYAASVLRASHRFSLIPGRALHCAHVRCAHM